MNFDSVSLKDMTIGAGIALIGIGFIIQQLRFWVKGAGNQTTEISLLQNLLRRVEAIECKISVHGEDLVAIKTALEYIKGGQ